jgi:hypothetical protein
LILHLAAVEAHAKSLSAIGTRQVVKAEKRGIYFSGAVFI